MIRDIIAQEVGGGAEMGADMDAGDIEGMGDEAPIEEPGMEAEPEMGAEDEEEIDLDELLRELEATTEETVEEGEDKEEEEPMEEAVEEEIEESTELAEALETIESLRKDLQEVNLLNSKLLYVNKIFKANNLTESQKVNVIAAFDKAYDAGNKMKSDVEQSVYQKIALLNQFAGMTYNAEQYEAAGELYETEAKYSDAIDQLDSAAVFNSSLCYEKAEKYEKAAIGYERLAKVNYRGTTSAILASSSYRKAGNLEKAKAIIAEARKTNPSDKELLLELVNTNIDAGDAAGAEKALADAIKTDPNNKQLHYTIGTIYIDLKENEKAEIALNKALEIDPNYADAQYQLGAHLVTWAGDLKLQADQMPFGDANYNKVKQQSGEVYERALIPLEKYIINYPEDKAVLTILFQLQRNLGNSEKALEYKKRADAIK